MKEIKNWKLLEVKEDVQIINEDSMAFIDEELVNWKLPVKYNERMHRSESFIDWSLMPQHFYIFTDYEDEVEKIKSRLAKSALGEIDDVIITYGKDEPVVKLPTKIFINNWEDFLISTLYQTLIFGVESPLVIEVTRDYYMHSNFYI